MASTTSSSGPNGVTPNEAGAESIADWLAPQLLDLRTQPTTEQAAGARPPGRDP